MRILITTPSLDESNNVSGISSVVAGILNEFARVKFNVAFDLFIVGRKDGKDNAFRWILRQALLPFSLIYRLLTYRPDIIHINGPLDWLAAPRDAIVIFIARIFFIKTIYHIHGGPFVFTKSRSIFVLYFIKFSLTLANKVIVLGKSEKSSIEGIYKCIAGKIFVLPNSVHVINTSTISYSNSNELRILYMGRFVESKGIKVLVESLHELSRSGIPFSVAIYGAGPLENYIIDSLSDFLKDKFKFGGIAKRDEMDAIFSQTDILVLPSLWEGLPMVILESLAHGVPVIATNVGSISEAIVNNYNGILIPTNNKLALCEAINKVIEDKKTGIYDMMCRNANKTALEKYNICTYVNCLYSAYSDIK